MAGMMVLATANTISSASSNASVQIFDHEDLSDEDSHCITDCSADMHNASKKLKVAVEAAKAGIARWRPRGGRFDAPSRLRLLLASRRRSRRAIGDGRSCLGGAALPIYTYNNKAKIASCGTLLELPSKLTTIIHHCHP